MPIFTFEGFTEGSLVAMSAAQGAQGAAGSVPEWRLSNTNTATLDIARIEPAELVAPVGIWFEATDLQGFAVSEPGPGEGPYDPTAHDITYIWDFDDPGTFTAPLNIPTVWNNKGIDYGKKAYHVFDTPGSYVVRLWAIDREGVTGERMVSITVLDPDEAYPGTSTICISNQGDFTGAPAGALLLGSLSAAQTAYLNLGRPGRLLLRRGEIFTGGLGIDDPMRNCHIGTFGAGPKPVWRPVGDPTFGGVCISAAFNHNVPAATIWGIRFEGEWDATKETGDPRQEAINMLGFNTVASFHNLIYQCEFDGMSIMQPHQTEPPEGTTAIVDCDIGNFRDYGIFIGGSTWNSNHRFAIVGTTIHSAENACIGGYGKNGIANHHGPFRYGEPINVVVSVSDFYSASSWAGGVQPAVRFAQKIGGLPPDSTGYYVQCDRCVFEGGDTIFGVDGQNRDAEEIPGNHIFDSILSVGDYMSLKFSAFAFGGTTMRNAIIVHPDLTRLPDAFPPETFISLGVNLPAAGNQDAPMKFYNNTFLNFSSVTMDVQRGSTFNDLTIENNVNHQPNAGVTGAAPVDFSQTIEGFSPRNRGRRVGPEKVQTSVSGVGNGQSFTIGYPAGTGQADFSSGGRHTVQMEGSYYFSYRGDCSLAFGATEITVTNLTGDIWTGSVRLGLDQETLTTDTSLGSPATLPLPVPQPGSPALTDDGGLRAYTQFDSGERIRPKGAT